MELRPVSGFGKGNMHDPFHFDPLPYLLGSKIFFGRSAYTLYSGLKNAKSIQTQFYIFADYFLEIRTFVIKSFCGSKNFWVQSFLGFRVIMCKFFW